MRSRALTILISILACVTMTAPAFAGEYQTTVDAFMYGNYQVPAYDGDPSEPVNGNLPAFSEEELTGEPYVTYGELDELGRCTTARSLLSQELMPTQARGEIGSVYPSGWVQQKYDVVPNKYLYNRCHLIGWQLAGADLNTLTKAELAKDLITGTRFLNVGTGSTGMVEYENDVAAYLREDADNEVAYRVTPVFGGNNLVAYGVLMEGRSVAANDVEFCVFCYNVQPEIAIDYETGESCLASALEDNKSLTECAIAVDAKAVYTGAEQFVAITVMDGDQVLTEGADYQTVWSSNIQPGKATVSIVGVGAYRGTVTYNFIIVPAKAVISKMTSAKAGSRAAVRVTLIDQEYVTGYQYAWRVKGKKKWTKAYSWKEAKTISSLKPGKRYQVRARAYKTVSGKKWYGAWSMKQVIKTKK